MSNPRVLQAIEKIQEELNNNQHALDSSLPGRVAKGKEASILIGQSFLRMLGTMGQTTSSKMNAGAMKDILGTIADPAALAALGLMPLTASLKEKSANIRDAKLKAEKAVIKNSPQDLNIADLAVLSKTSLGKISDTSTNLAITLGALGALGAPAVSHLASPLFMTGMALRNPISAGALGYGLTHAAQLKTSPFVAGYSALPGAASWLGGGALKLTGGIASHFGAAKLGGALGSAGSWLSSAGSGLVGTMPGAMLGGALLMALQPVINKINTAIEETATGTSLLRKGPSMRPRLISSSILEKQYSRIGVLQTMVRSQANNIPFKDYIIIQTLFDIAESNSLLRPLVEWWQENTSHNKSVGANIAQNKWQVSMGHTGDFNEDLYGAYQYPETDKVKSLLQYIKENAAEEKSMPLLRGLVQYAGTFFDEKEFQDRKISWAKNLQNISEKISLGADFLNPLNYLMGGEYSPFKKYQNLKEENLNLEVTKRISNLTGISTTAITLLNQTSTSIMDRGETAEEKQLLLTAGIFETTKFSMGKLYDIFKVLGGDENNSLLSLFKKTKDEAENLRDQSNPGFFSKMMSGFASSKYSGLTGAGIGALIGGLLGPAGAAAGAGLGYGASIISNLFSFKKERELYKKKEKLSAEEALNQTTSIQDYLNSGNINELTPDEEQHLLIEERRKEKEYQLKLKTTEQLQTIVKILKNKDEGLHISFSKKGNKRLSQFSKQLEKLNYLPGIYEEIDDAEDYLKMLTLCSCKNSLLGGGAAGGKGQKKGKSSRTRKGKARMRGGFATSRMLGGSLGMLGAGLSIASMANDEEVGHSSIETALGHALDMGMSGATIGASIGGIPGAIIGGLLGAATGGIISYFGDDLGITEPTEISQAKEKLEKLKPDLFHWYGDDGVWAKDKRGNLIFKLDDNSGAYVYKNNKWQFEKLPKSLNKAKVKTDIMPRKAPMQRPQKAVIVDAKTTQFDKRTSNVQLLKPAYADEKTEVYLYIQNKAKEFASKEKNPERIDTEKEMVALLEAIRQDQQVVGKMTTEQQNALQEILATQVQIMSNYNKQMVDLLNEIKKGIQSNDTLLPRPGNN